MYVCVGVGARRRGWRAGVRSEAHKVPAYTLPGVSARREPHLFLTPSTRTGAADCIPPSTTRPHGGVGARGKLANITCALLCSGVEIELMPNDAQPPHLPLSVLRALSRPSLPPILNGVSTLLARQSEGHLADMCGSILGTTPPPRLLTHLHLYTRSCSTGLAPPPAARFLATPQIRLPELHRAGPSTCAMPVRLTWT